MNKLQRFLLSLVWRCCIIGEHYELKIRKFLKKNKCGREQSGECTCLTHSKSTLVRVQSPVPLCLKKEKDLGL